MISTCTFMYSTGRHFTDAKCCVLSNYVGLVLRVKPPSPLRTAYCYIVSLRTAHRHILTVRTAYYLTNQSSVLDVSIY